LRATLPVDLGGEEPDMKFTASLLALCAIVPTEQAAATPLSCTAAAAAPACPPFQQLFGACPSAMADEVVCRTENKSLASPAHSSKTSYGYYSPPDGYSLEPETARAVFEGRGTHGVDASIAEGKQLYCLWGTAGGGYAAGYCEVRARLNKAR
jgi:hypothetical protein